MTTIVYINCHENGYSFFPAAPVLHRTTLEHSGPTVGISPKLVSPLNYTRAVHLFLSCLCIALVLHSTASQHHSIQCIGNVKQART